MVGSPGKQEWEGGGVRLAQAGGLSCFGTLLYHALSMLQQSSKRYIWILQLTDVLSRWHGVS